MKNILNYNYAFLATAGSVTDEQFRSSFEAVPVVKVGSLKLRRRFFIEIKAFFGD